MNRIRKNDENKLKIDFFERPRNPVNHAKDSFFDPINQILELKSVRKIIRAHKVQLVNYLVATRKPVGLILNFGERMVEIKRKLRQLNG